MQQLEEKALMTGGKENLESFSGHFDFLHIGSKITWLNEFSLSDKNGCLALSEL